MTPSGPNRKIPRYKVIKNHLLEQIESGAIGPEDKTESENVLASRFSVSRLTVQRAIRELVSEGILNRVQGSGTFVTPRTTRFSLFEVKDLAEEVRMRGSKPSAKVLVQRQIIPSENVRTLMELGPDVAVFQATILRKSDDVPFAIEDRFARCDVFENFLEKDFEKESIYDYLARHSSLQTIETNLRAILPDEAVRDHLGLSQNDPCLFLERRNWYEGRVVTLTRITGSRFSLGSRYDKR
ncbi:MAG: UTRA domain-containing protein [Hyphomonadaceae bacterium]|nr:UTRA domain-containing protein [Hyphomonadaceae bacterium]